MTTAELAADRTAQQMHDSAATGVPPDAVRRRRVDGLVMLMLVPACLIGVGVGGLAYRSMQAATESGQREAHTRAVMSQLDEFLSSLKDAETGQRGFIITGQPEYLEPYHASVGLFAAQLERLRLLTTGNPRQQQRIAALTQGAQERMAIPRETIAVRQTQGLLAASEAVKALAGKKSMDQLRALVAQAKTEEAENLKSHATQSGASLRRTLEAVLLGGTLGALALLLLFACLRRELASRHEAEKELRHIASQYQMLIDSIDEAFCIVELIFDDGKVPVDYRFLEVNPAFERQTGMSDAKGRRMLELVPDMEDITGAITCCYDVTERTRLQHETAEQAQALTDLHWRKDEFLAMLSHELRNPLAALSNALQLLRLPADADPLQRHSRGIMERQLKHLKHLVDDLLEVSRITTGNVRLRLEQASLNSIVENAVDAAKPLIAQHRHALTVSMPQAAVFVHADGQRRAGGRAHGGHPGARQRPGHCARTVAAHF